MYNKAFYDYIINCLNYKHIFYLTNYGFLKKFTNRKSFLGHKVGKKFGIQKISVHSSMNRFLLGNRTKIAFIDIKITMKKIIKNLYVLLKIIKRNGHILIVNTNPEMNNIINYFATKIEKNKNHFSYCNSKWVGGTLTNWNQISTSIATFVSFSKRFGNFITQNNIHFPKYRKLKKSFQGFAINSHGGSGSQKEFPFIFNKVKYKPTPLSNNLNIKQSSMRQKSYIQSDNLSNKGNKKSTKKPKLIFKKPDILIVVNPNENIDVLHEAKNLNIPVIGLIDSNTDLNFITYPIPVNNNSLFFVQFFFSLFAKVLMLKKKVK